MMSALGAGAVREGTWVVSLGTSGGSAGASLQGEVVCESVVWWWWCVCLWCVWGCACGRLGGWCVCGRRLSCWSCVHASDVLNLPTPHLPLSPHSPPLHPWPPGVALPGCCFALRKCCCYAPSWAADTSDNPLLAAQAALRCRRRPAGTLFGPSNKPILDPTCTICPFADATGKWLPLLCTINCTGVTEEVGGAVGVGVGVGYVYVGCAGGGKRRAKGS